ncbi:MAG: hypothetical protein HY695_24925 [Deltaproteobacteria bacterium]|nr:hypothetical protein [Deltaproteobacteria bacterium]
MSKKERRNRKAKGHAVGSRRRSKLRPAGIVMVGAGMVVALFFLFPKTEPWGLPAIPRNPRPATVSSELFTGSVARAYEIAEEAPELLERMPCYCGCYVNPGHRNNLDCYTDRHGAG